MIQDLIDKIKLIDNDDDYKLVDLFYNEHKFISSDSFDDNYRFITEARLYRDIILSVKTDIEKYLLRHILVIFNYILKKLSTEDIKRLDYKKIMAYIIKIYSSQSLIKSVTKYRIKADYENLDFANQLMIAFLLRIKLSDIIIENIDNFLT